MPTVTNNVTGNDNAIEGTSIDGRGIVGKSETNYGIRAHSKTLAGIRGSSDEGRGVEGWANKSEGGVGSRTNGNAVWGQTEGAGIGVLGSSKSGVGVWGVSDKHEGMHAETKSTGTAALAAFPMNASARGLRRTIRLIRSVPCCSSVCRTSVIRVLLR